MNFYIFCRVIFSADLDFLYDDQSLSNNIDNKRASVNCLSASGVKHCRYKNMILKLTPVLMTVIIIKGLSFEVKVHH